MDSTVEQDSQGSCATGQKRRKASEDDRAKHRSSLACQSCRARKVRCDVLTNGARCTNCRLDSLVCVVLPSRRGKNNRSRRTGGSNTQTNPPQVYDAATDPQSHAARPDEKTRPTTASTAISPTEAVPVVVTFDEESDGIEDDHQSAASNPRLMDETNHATSAANEQLSTPESGLNWSERARHAAQRVSLPAFIAPLSSRIASEDLDFLVRKGATTVPEPDLYMEILRGYLFSVHPFMPMLDFRAFIHAVVNNREDGRISLLLFQALMFTGLHPLSLQTIRRLGFESTKQAREVFFNRARLLYEFDIEPDSATILQSLILMSTWYGKWDERRHTWHWTGLAHDAARNMGLHREPTSKHSSDKMRRFRRRLWWSLYIRDRMIALGTRRPLRIHDNDFDVAMLTLEDFDLDPLEESYRRHSLAPSVEESTSTALMCIQLAKLCVIIGRATSSQYTTLNTDPDVPHTMMVVPRRDGGGTKELENCNRELNEWFGSLAANVRRNVSSGTREDPHSCSEIHWAVLNLTYLTVMNALHRPQALQPLLAAGKTHGAANSSRSMVKNAARGLTKLSQKMLRHDQVRFLGTIGVTALVAACLSHMLDISSGDEDIRDASTLRLYQSLEVLRKLTDIYASADAAVSFLTSVTRKAGISIPAHITETALGPMLPPIDKMTVSSHVGYNHMAKQESIHPATQADSANAPPMFPSGTWQHHPSHSYAVPVNHPLQSPPAMNRTAQMPTPSRTMQPIARPDQMSPPVPAPGNPTDQAPIHPGINRADAASVPHFVDPVTGALTASTGRGDSFDWTNTVDTSMHLEPMAFTYDFYSDAFGFLDGRF